MLFNTNKILPKIKLATLIFSLVLVSCGKKASHKNSDLSIQGYWVATNLTLTKEDSKIDLTKDESNSYMLVIESTTAQLYQLGGQIKQMRGQKQDYKYNGRKLEILKTSRLTSSTSDLFRYEADVVKLEQNSLSFANLKMEDEDLFASIDFKRVDYQESVAFFNKIPAYKVDTEAPKTTTTNQTKKDETKVASPTFTSSDLDGFWMLYSIDAESKTYNLGDKFSDETVFTKNLNIIHFNNGRWTQFLQGNSQNKDYATFKIAENKIYLNSYQYIDVKWMSSNKTILKTAPLIISGINSEAEYYKKISDKEVAEILFANEYFNQLFPGNISIKPSELNGFYRATTLTDKGATKDIQESYKLKSVIIHLRDGKIQVYKCYPKTNDDSVQCVQLYKNYADFEIKGRAIYIPSQFGYKEEYIYIKDSSLPLTSSSIVVTSPFIFSDSSLEINFVSLGANTPYELVGDQRLSK